MQKIVSIAENALTLFWQPTLSRVVHQHLMAWYHYLGQNPFEGFLEAVPAYHTLTIFYDPLKIPTTHNSPAETLKKNLFAMANQIKTNPILLPRLIEIPVCYDETLGNDLAAVAAQKGVSTDTIVRWHCEKEYYVYMLGFMPGFAYMGKVSKKLATPRKATPRKAVAAGSVGIAGSQTGIYPLESPGGWQILGRTPLRMLDWQRKKPFLLAAGNEVRFFPIKKQMYSLMQTTPRGLVSTPEIAENNNDEIIVLKAGVLATLQDEGRVGLRAYGVPNSGAMDWKAYKIANLLLQNPPNAVVIECAMGGLALQFRKNTEIALTGGGQASLAGKKIPFYAPITVKKNDILELHFYPNGIRTYLAISGGIVGNEMAGSRSVYGRGLLGKALQKGQSLAIGKKTSFSSHTHLLDLAPKVQTSAHTLRLIAGHELSQLLPESIATLFEKNFQLSMQCDRMGYRLQGTPLKMYPLTEELLSRAVSIGTVQCTPDGQLIVLMNDGQTVGGYPVVGKVAFVDLPILAQLKPNDTIRWQSIGFEWAETLYLQTMKEYATITN